MHSAAGLRLNGASVTYCCYAAAQAAFNLLPDALKSITITDTELQDYVLPESTAVLP